MTTNPQLQIKFAENTPKIVKKKILSELNSFAQKNAASIQQIPENVREQILYQIVEKMLQNEGINAKYKEYITPPNDLSGIDLCEPF